MISSQMICNSGFLSDAHHQWPHCSELKKPIWSLIDDLYVGGDEVHFVHLGITWMKNKTCPDVDESIKAARRTTYSLLGAGLHGNNGLDPIASSKTIQLYVTPRLVHGLDAAVLPRKDMDKMEAFYRKLLRQVQGLPESTANCAVYLLMGCIPVEGTLHLRTLGLFGNITRLELNHPMRRLAARQLALTDTRPLSWFT